MAPPIPTPEELGLSKEARAVDTLARDILGDTYLHFHLRKLNLIETAQKEPADNLSDEVSMEVELEKSLSGDIVTVSAAGVGLLDALFEGFTAAFAQEYPSLKTIEVADFSVASHFLDDKKGAKKRRTDALAKSELTVRNSEGTLFHFHHAATSLTRSAVRVAVDALTFFVNSERAYVQMHLAVEDAKERRRSDLVQKYSQKMGILVAATSYSEVIEKLRKEGG